jgi:hypothetical protein
MRSAFVGYQRITNNMEQESLMPVAVADYYSEANWNAFLALWPEEQRAKATTYAEAAKSLDEFMGSAKAIELNAHRVKVNASEWAAWVVSSGYPKTRESVAAFAASQLAKERRGLLVRPDE